MAKMSLDRVDYSYYRFEVASGAIECEGKIFLWVVGLLLIVERSLSSGLVLRKRNPFFFCFSLVWGKYEICSRKPLIWKAQVSHEPRFLKNSLLTVKVDIFIQMLGTILLMLSLEWLDRTFMYSKEWLS